MNGSVMLGNNKHQNTTF